MIRKTCGAVLLLALTACGACGQILINAGGATFPYSDVLEVVRRIPQEISERSDQLPVDRLRRRHPAGDRGHRRFRRQRSVP